MHYADLTRRIRDVLQGRSNEAIAEWAGVSAESVRRYLSGDVPPVRFLLALCKHEHVCGNWLLSGEGYPRKTEPSLPSIRKCELAALLGEVGRRLDDVVRGEMIGSNAEGESAP